MYVFKFTDKTRTYGNTSEHLEAISDFANFLNIKPHEEVIVPFHSNVFYDIFEQFTGYGEIERCSLDELKFLYHFKVNPKELSLEDDKPVKVAMRDSDVEFAQWAKSVYKH